MESFCARLKLVVLVFGLVLPICNAQSMEATVLKNAMKSWQNGMEVLGQTWTGDNPCAGWEGVTCNAMSNVVILSLTSKNLTGPLPELTGLKFLQDLVLEFNKFTGPIPASYSTLNSLVTLKLKNNQLSGPIPPQLGSGLQNLTCLDLDNNPGITGDIPSSLGQLTKLTILHLSVCSLTGEIPPELGNLFNLNELTIWGNNLSGGIPYQIGNLRNLTYINLHDSSLRGNLPPEMGNLSQLTKLWLYNNDFYGGIPEEWGGMVSLSSEMAIRNNRLTGPVPSSIQNWINLTKLDIVNNYFTGPIPRVLENMTKLNTVKLAENYFNGTPPSLRRDLLISSWADQNCLDDSTQNQNGGAQKSAAVCSAFYNSLIDGCGPCPQPGTYHQTPNPCRCRTPLEIWLRYSALTVPFQETIFTTQTALSLQIKATQVVVQSNVSTGTGLDVKFWLVPDRGDYLRKSEVAYFVSKFNSSGVTSSFGGYTLLNFTSPDQWPTFPPTYPYKKPNDTSTPGKRGGNSINAMPIVVGVLVALVVLGIAGALFLCCRIHPEEDKPSTKKFSTEFTTGKTKGERTASTTSLAGTKSEASHSRTAGGLSVTNARIFNLQELSDACDGFAKENEIGVGGHAKVYKGVLPNVGEVAVKRAKLRAVQGREFKNELDVLSRVHHRNLVRFLGCCEDEDEQVLVYEYMKNGTLHDHLLGKSGAVLDWRMRIDIAIGTANGLTYLHNHADPPIIHRDIKPSNILLDENLKAKLGDFGISRMIDEEVVYTRVAGTLGYLDPMYHETRHLTDKSDVYSFGVVLLELVTGKDPHGLKKSHPSVGMIDWVEKEYSNGGLDAIIDVTLNGRYPYDTMCRIVEIGLWCTRPTWDQRPAMKEVLTALEQAKKVAEKESVPEDSQTLVEVFGKHLFQTFGGRKPDVRTPSKGGRLFTEEQLLEDPSGGSTFSMNTMQQMDTRVEGR